MSCFAVTLKNGGNAVLHGPAGMSPAFVVSPFGVDGEKAWKRAGGRVLLLDVVPMRCPVCRASFDSVEEQDETTAPGYIPPAPIEPAPIEPAPIEPAPIEPAPIEPAPIEPMPMEEEETQP